MSKVFARNIERGIRVNQGVLKRGKGIMVRRNRINELDLNIYVNKR